MIKDNKEAIETTISRKIEFEMSRTDAAMDVDGEKGEANEYERTEATTRDGNDQMQSGQERTEESINDQLTLARGTGGEGKGDGGGDEDDDEAATSLVKVLARLQRQVRSNYGLSSGARPGDIDAGGAPGR